MERSMTDLMEIKAATGELAHAFEAFKDANDERLAAIERKRGDVVLEEKVNRISGDVTKLQDAVSSLKTVVASSVSGDGGGASIMVYSVSASLA